MEKPRWKYFKNLLSQDLVKKDSQDGSNEILFWKSRYKIRINQFNRFLDVNQTMDMNLTFSHPEYA